MLRPAFLLAIISLLAIGFTLGGAAQKQYTPYAQWDKKDVEKMLNDSPWAQTQTNTDTEQMVVNDIPASVVSKTGALREAASWYYHVMLMSARPVREAIFRRVEITQGPLSQALAAQLQGFVDRDFSDYIVIAVTYDSKDPRFMVTPKQAFDTAQTNLIKTDTYLDRSDGKRQFLRQYIPPANDGLGAKFIFDRMFEGKAFLDSSFSQVRFYSIVANRILIDRRFKIKDMVYNGKLEY